MNTVRKVESDDTNDVKESYIDNATSMLKIVKTDRGGNLSGNIISIDGLLTDKLEPNIIFDVLFKATSVIDLKEFIANKHNIIKDINTIRMTNIILDIINNKKIDNRTIEFRELAISSDSYYYTYDYHQDPHTVPSTFIEDLKDKFILSDSNYILSTHIDKLIASLGYINLVLYIDINKYSFND